MLARVRHSLLDSFGWAQGRWSKPPTPVMTGSLWWDSNPHFRLSQDRSLFVEIQRRPNGFSIQCGCKERSKVVLWINLTCELRLDVSTINGMIFGSQGRKIISMRLEELRIRSGLFSLAETRGTIACSSRVKNSSNSHSKQ